MLAQSRTSATRTRSGWRELRAQSDAEFREAVETSFFRFFHRCCCETRTKESNIVCQFLRSVSRHGLRSPTCKFLGSLTRLEPTAMGGELWITCEGTGVSTGGRARSSLFLLQCGSRSPTRVHNVVYGNAWICACLATDRDLERVSAVKKVNAWTCALMTTDHDPASVIHDKKKNM